MKKDFEIETPKPRREVTAAMAIGLFLGIVTMIIVTVILARTFDW
jgi:hypothetical protein